MIELPPRLVDALVVQRDQPLGVVDVDADVPSSRRGELRPVGQQLGVDADVAGRRAGEERVDAEGGEQAAGVAGKADLQSRRSRLRCFSRLSVVTCADTPSIALISAASEASVESSSRPSRSTLIVCVVVSFVVVL